MIVDNNNNDGDCGNSSCNNSNITMLSKVSINFIFKSIQQPSIIINQPISIIDINSSKHHDNDNNNLLKEKLIDDHNDDNNDNTRTSYNYTGRHDHGKLPILQTSNTEALELLSCLLEAKNNCDDYLTSCINHEYGYTTTTTTTTTNSTSSRSSNSNQINSDNKTIIDDKNDDDVVVDSNVDDADIDDEGDDGCGNESYIVTKRIKLDDSSRSDSSRTVVK